MFQRRTRRPTVADATRSAGVYSAPSGNSSGDYSGNPSRGNLPSNYTDVEQFSRQAAAKPVPLPPEPLTEFQKFVASTTGQILPIYGASLFRSVPSTFAPLDMTPVPPDYVIGPGDELRIRVWGQVSFQANVRVDRSGEILPSPGRPGACGGHAFFGAGCASARRGGRVYHNFDLTVDVGQIRAIQVYVSGAGAASRRLHGEFAEHAGGRAIRQRRAFGARLDARTSSCAAEARWSPDFDLYDLLIQRRQVEGREAAVRRCDLHSPGRPPGRQSSAACAIPPSTNCGQMNRLPVFWPMPAASSAVAAEARISIERIDESSRPARHGGGLRSPAVWPRPWPTATWCVSSRSCPYTEKTVILRGNTANPGRFAWHAGHAHQRSDSGQGVADHAELLVEAGAAWIAGAGVRADAGLRESAPTLRRTTPFVNLPFGRTLSAGKQGR